MKKRTKIKDCGNEKFRMLKLIIEKLITALVRRAGVEVENKGRPRGLLHYDGFTVDCIDNPSKGV